jgi:hypothetical protein
MWVVTDWEHQVYFSEWLDPATLLLCALLLLPSICLGYLAVTLGRPRSRLLTGVVLGVVFCLLQMIRARFSLAGDAGLWRFDFRWLVCAVGLLGPIVGTGVAGLLPLRVIDRLPSNNRWRGP